ncbi:MAG: malate synthase G [Acidimicrobiales bacterium]|nr:malate synthase G [Acidimicrobiales bacterium]
MAETYVTVGGLQYGEALHRFIVDEALPGSGMDEAEFFAGMDALIKRFAGENAKLLAERDRLQSAIDSWHRERSGQAHDAETYRAFLEEIGYLLPPAEDVLVATTGVDPEIALAAGPQLVVPVMNARYAINAANARWGSLYDALYGTDAMGDLPTPGPYDAARGDRVIAFAKAFLDDVVPLSDGSHANTVRYHIEDAELVAELSDGRSSGLDDSTAFEGYRGAANEPTTVLLRHHGLGIQLLIDRNHTVGATDRAGVADVTLESALTSIMDCEDSVAAVDAEDKALAYRNWLGLLRGDLEEIVTKGDRTFTRTMAPDETFTGPDGSSTVTVPGRALMLVRNVGHLMTTPAVLTTHGSQIPEGLLDSMMTTLCALHDLRSVGGNRNSRTGSFYVVKPKMHGPAEVAFTDRVFTFVEETLRLEPNTVKLGIMDEERRTTLNLAACIEAAKNRVAFINTGFLDRTGDEIHTSMEAGPMVRKADMKAQRWIHAYEDWNVDVGLACGLRGRAQIGKGMWAAPDRMAAMLAEKIGHPRAGASCAWVPSPTAATLHATHYHRVLVAEIQAELEKQLANDGPRATIDDLLRIPVAVDPRWSEAEIQAELDNNAQGILGYVVRWVDQGVGCSKVPDINDVGLMEDRATCRISSQHMANWLRHGVVDARRIQSTMETMAVVVDGQNAGDESYEPMAPDFTGPAFRAAYDLVLSGTEQPSGYTEPILHARRLQKKASERAKENG